MGNHRRNFFGLDKSLRIVYVAADWQRNRSGQRAERYAERNAVGVRFKAGSMSRGRLALCCLVCIDGMAFVRAARA
jgi:hypothetical protein